MHKFHLPSLCPPIATRGFHPPPCRRRIRIHPPSQRTHQHPHAAPLLRRQLQPPRLHPRQPTSSRYRRHHRPHTPTPQTFRHRPHQVRRTRPQQIGISTSPHPRRIQPRPTISHSLLRFTPHHRSAFLLQTPHRHPQRLPPQPTTLTTIKQQLMHRPLHHRPLRRPLPHQTPTASTPLINLQRLILTRDPSHIPPPGSTHVRAMFGIRELKKPAYIRQTGFFVEQQIEEQTCSVCQPSNHHFAITSPTLRPRPWPHRS